MASMRPMTRAFVDLSGRRLLNVGGGEARTWLNDLVSADIGGLEPGQALRSLLLSPTGRIRADFTVAAAEDGYLLIQHQTQARALFDLLGPYTLSSDVTLQDRSDELSLLAVPAGADPGEPPAGHASRPSCLGEGVDVIAPAADREELATWLVGRRLRAADADEAERWRIERAIPRFGVDATEEDLPMDAGLDAAVAVAKGCYLGQEAVAKVRNLGHPRRMLLALAADAPVTAGEVLTVRGREAGLVTSATPAGGGAVLLAKVRWDARDGPFVTAAGVHLETRQVPDRVE